MSIRTGTVSTAGKRGAGPLATGKPGGLSMNRKNLRSVREVSLDNYDAEYMYLRENELTRFDADVKLDYLRVLDLSINEIGGQVDFLHMTPHLHHLYMTGNKIDSLAGICNFAALETLCLSDNAISSFEGLENLPSLRVLSLNFNSIFSFESYPTLPSLHTLNLVGNPVTEVPTYRSMAIAVNGPNLVSIDGNAVQPEERAAVEHFQGKIVYCIREGFIVEGDDVDEAAHEFLLKIQRQREMSKCLQLCSVRLASAEEGSNVLTEGVPVNLALCMQDARPYAQRTAEIFHSRYLYPVIFKVSGEATEVFVVGSMNGWADPIRLERCEEDGEVYFHTTLYLPAGDYEYRYIVDGVEKVSESNRITSKYNKGFCNLYQVTELEPQEEEQDTILHIRWMRGNANGVFGLIEDENSLSYTPAITDIGCCLRTEVLAYINGEFSFLYFDISSPIVAANPNCTHLEVKGNPVEGTVLMAEADYVGGVEGTSTLAWYRVSADGEEVFVEQRDPWAGYKLTKEDIGSRIRVEFTPIRNDWVAGEPKSVVTEPVVPCDPECEAIKIVGSLVEGGQLEVDVAYIGGDEGDSVFQWLRRSDKSDEYLPIEGGVTTRYVPTVEDVGAYLAVEYTPVNAEGKEGETCRCVLENPIEPTAPMVRNLTIVGDLEEGSVLTLEYEYTGGHFGAHMIQWYRRDNRQRLVKIGQTNSNFATLSLKEVGCPIEVSFTPVRSDGARGRPVQAKTEGVVKAGKPEVKFLHVIGEPMVGSELTIEMAYFGGVEGASTIEWEVEDPEMQMYETAAEGVSKYIVRRGDCGKRLRVVYTPAREDGEVGEPYTEEIQISADLPTTTVPASRTTSQPEQQHADPIRPSALSEPDFVTEDETLAIETAKESGTPSSSKNARVEEEEEEDADEVNDKAAAKHEAPQEEEPKAHDSDDDSEDFIGDSATQDHAVLHENPTTDFAEENDQQSVRQETEDVQTAPAAPVRSVPAPAPAAAPAPAPEPAPAPAEVEEAPAPVPASRSDGNIRINLNKTRDSDEDSDA